jgi:hypothetical protein
MIGINTKHTKRIYFYHKEHKEHRDDSLTTDFTDKHG